MRGIASSSLAIILLVFLPTLALALLGVRALEQETSLRQLEVLTQQDLRLKLVDRELNANINKALLRLHSPIAEDSQSRRAIRDFVMSDDGVELVVINTLAGARDFPPETIQALPREQNLMSKYAKVIDKQLAQLSAESSSSTLALGPSAEMRLLHCWLNKRRFCLLISKTWIEPMLKELLSKNYTDEKLSLTIEKGAGLTGEEQFFWPLSDTLSGWYLEYQPRQQAGYQHLLPVYAAIFFPMVVLLIGIGAWLYSIQKRYLKENERRAIFLRLVAHEFKTPLANLRLYSSLVRRSDSHQETLGYMDVFDAEFFRMRRFLNNATYFEHPDLNTNPSLEVLDIKPFLTQLLQPFLPRLESNGVELSISGSDCENIKIAREVLECAVVNLIDNIIKYAPHKPASINFCMEADWLFVKIKDGGEGIAPAQRQNLFRYNQQIGSRYDGFGLGLVVTKQLIDNAGGYICYTTTQGSTFELKIPVHKVSETV